MSTSPLSAQAKLRTLAVKLPESVVERLGPTSEDAARHLEELALIELFRAGELSGGRAAELLGLSRGAWLELLARRGVPHSEVSEDDLEHDLQVLADWKRRASTSSQTPGR